MELEMVLNELSLQPLADNVLTARQRMSVLVTTMSAATRSGVSKVLRTHRDLNAEELASGYPIGRWRNDYEVDRDVRRFFTSLATKAPYLIDVSDPIINDKVNNSDFLYEERKAAGLGVAYLLDTLALSIRSAPCWYPGHLEMTYTYLDIDGDILEEIVTVTHASHKDHIIEHANWIKQYIQKEINDGLSICQNREELFPHLLFCESALEQIKHLPHNDPMVQPVRKRLLELDFFCENWHSGTFNANAFTSKVTPESSVTLGMYGQERTFRCPDGDDRTFSWHARLTPGAWRLYFYPDIQARKLIIGYVGPKMRTVST